MNSLSPPRPGYLRTPLTTGPTYEEQVDAYAALLDSIGVDRVAVYGLSAGGPPAIHFAARHPDRTSALLLGCAVTQTYAPEIPRLAKLLFLSAPATDGDYVTEWTHVVRPDDLYIDSDDNLFVPELGLRAGLAPKAEIPPHAPHARVSVLTLDGEVQTRFGGEDPLAPGNFFAPHGIWADSRGDLYVSEVVYSAGGRQGLVPLDCHSLQKFVRVRSN